MGWVTTLIVLLLTACDNLDWGGAEFAIVPPPAIQDQSEAGVELDEVTPETPPTGPVLYYVRTEEEEALLTPIAEITPDALIPINPTGDWEIYSQRFISQSMRQGTEFVLFHQGERAGTFVLQSAMLPEEESCPRIPHATGILELVESAREVPEFLAIAKNYAPTGGRRRTAPSLRPDPRISLQAAILAERALRARNARLPNNWTTALTDLHPFPITGSADPAFAATFALRDSTSRGANPAGYSLFLIAQPQPQVGYDATYLLFTDYATSEKGKAAPRVIDSLDWNRTGSTGLLLEVSTDEESWFEAVELTDGEWRHVLDTRCYEEPEATDEEEDEIEVG